MKTKHEFQFKAAHAIIKKKDVNKIDGDNKHDGSTESIFEIEPKRTKAYKDVEYRSFQRINLHELKQF